MPLRFVIALGYKGEQVRKYLERYHGDLDLTFTTVLNFDGPGSGPGLTMKTCREALSSRDGSSPRDLPFYFVACDTLWEDEKKDGGLCAELHGKQSWAGVKEVKQEESGRYGGCC